MSEPQRLIDDPGLADELRLSLQARALGPGLPEAIKERVAQRLAATLALPIAADLASQVPPTPVLESLGSGLAGTAPSGLTAAGLIKAVTVTVAGASLITGAGAGAVLLSTPPPSAPVAHTAHTAHLPPKMDPRPDLPSTAPEQSTSVAPLPAPRPAASSATVATASGTAASATANNKKQPDQSAAHPSAAPSVERQRMLLEANALRAVKSALDSSPSTALRLLNEHARTYPHSQLAVERKVLTLRAHVALGQTTRARQLADALLEDPGAALYHPLARELLETGAGAAPGGNHSD